MTLTDIALVIFTFLLLAYAVYDEFIMDKKNGKTLLRVNLQRRNKIDAIIFIGLVAILLYNNVNAHGSPITTYLLISLGLVAFYISFIRWPKMLLKPTGFYYANIFIHYARIQTMNLSEDGVLVIQLEQKKLLVRVSELDDLERIYKVMVSYQ
ncbi:DUF986 family protein [Rouxiella sp. S1S-2]|uniref:DUF986 family protein n=1 Tax=Rouxiella sp. S1S-2 TaxID=2653856 RepID=UPI00126418DC|nr:DUF986 family protein [Rouxiella sp. S1S-2]KAB7896046.1 DUF986 family protein [Rouxiella sp. S1S-2]